MTADETPLHQLPGHRVSAEPAEPSPRPTAGVTDGEKWALLGSGALLLAGGVAAAASDRLWWAMLPGLAAMGDVGAWRAWRCHRAGDRENAAMSAGQVALCAAVAWGLCTNSMAAWITVAVIGVYSVVALQYQVRRDRRAFRRWMDRNLASPEAQSMRGTNPTPAQLVERLAQGWVPGYTRPRRTRREPAAEPTTAAGPNASLAATAALRIVMDFRKDGSVLRAIVMPGPQTPGNLAHPFGGDWPPPGPYNDGPQVGGGEEP